VAEPEYFLIKLGKEFHHGPSFVVFSLLGHFYGSVKNIHYELTVIVRSFVFYFAFYLLLGFLFRVYFFGKNKIVL